MKSMEMSWNVKCGQRDKGPSPLCSFFVLSIKDTVKHCISMVVYVKCVLQKEQGNSAAARKNNSCSIVQLEADNEFYSKDRFATVQDALKIFQDDDLMFKPGTAMANELQCGIKCSRGCSMKITTASCV
jgi:hypothetical protein